MGLFGRIRRFFGGKDASGLQREGGWDVLGGTSTKPWTRADGIWSQYSQVDLEGAYNTAAIIQACVKMKATVASEVWMQVGVWDDSSWEPGSGAESDAFYDLMRRPNGQMDYREFVWNVVTHLELTGISYVAKFRDRGKQITGIWPFPSSSVSEMKDPKGNLNHYRINQGGGNALLVAPDDMFVVRYPDPTDPSSGSSPLSSAVRDLQIDNARTNLLIEILTNTHFASTVFQRGKGLWSETEKAAIRASFKDKIGPGRRGDALFLSGEGADVKFPTAPTDIDWPGTSSLAETRICAAFGVPPILVSLRAGLERSTYSNFEQALRAFYRLTMKPLWNLLASALERGLFVDEDDSETEVEPSIEDVAELQEDLDAQHTRARADFHGGAISLDRYRELIGEDALPKKQGDLYVMPMNIVPFIVDGESLESPAETTETEDPDDDEEAAAPEGDNPDDWETEEPGEGGESKSILDCSDAQIHAMIGAPSGGNGKDAGGNGDA